MFGFAIIVSPILRVAKGEGGGGREYQLRITPIIFKHSRITRITEKKYINYNNKYPIIIWSEEIRGGGTKKRVEVGVIAMYF